MHTIVITSLRGINSRVYSDDPNTEIRHPRRGSPDAEDIRRSSVRASGSTDALQRKAAVRKSRIAACGRLFLVAQMSPHRPRVGF